MISPRNLDLLMEKIPTLFNYILSLPMLLYFRNMLTYTVLTLDCTSSYVHLWTLKYVDMNQCILSCVLMALVYIHNTTTWIQMWKQCVVFLQQTAPSKYTLSRCSFTTGADKYHTKTYNIQMKFQTAVSLCTVHFPYWCAYLPPHTIATTICIPAHSQNQNF